jgi:hypothetical protein
LAEVNANRTAAACGGRRIQVCGATHPFEKRHAPAGAAGRTARVAVVEGIEHRFGEARRGEAGTAGKAWFEHVARVVPAEMVLSFTPETLADRLKDAVEPDARAEASVPGARRSAKPPVCDPRQLARPRRVYADVECDHNTRERR